MKLFRAVVIGALLVALPACTVTTPASTQTGPTYTCCEAADINRDYQPGDTLELHWVVVPGRLSSGSPTRELQLNARLTGPYATVSNLKNANVGGEDLAAGSTFAAQPIRPSGQPEEQPVSLILIPPTAPPGYYNLTTSISGSGFSSSGGTVIQVISKT